MFASHLFQRVRLSAIALLLIAGGQTAFGQGQFGAIAGTVTDASGGAIPRAKVAAINAATSVRIEAISNDVGAYQLLQLTPGAYTVEAEANGFKKGLRSNVQVQVADRITLGITLEVGSLTETVNVAAEAAALRTSDAQTGEVINKR